MNRIQRTISSYAVLLGAALLVPMLLASPGTAAAFGLYGADAKLGMVDPDGVDGTIAMGVGLNFQQEGSQVHLTPNVMFWSENGLSDVNPNFDASYHFAPAGAVSPYVGAGFGLHFYSADRAINSGTDPGANFFGGILIPSRGATFQLEGRMVASDRSEFGLMTGATFYLGH